MTPSGADDTQAAGSPTRGSLRVRAVTSVLWALASFGSSKLVIFLMTLALARILTPTEFGVVAAGLTVIVLLEIGLDLGVGAAVVYEQEHGLTTRVRTAYSINLALAAVMTTIGVLAAPVIAEVFQVREWTDLFRVLFLYLLLRGAAQGQMAVLQRDLRFRERTIIDVSIAVVRALASVGLALVGLGPWALVLGLLAGEVVGTALAIAFVRLRPALRLRREVVTGLLHFGLAVLGTRVVSAALSGSDRIIIGNRLGPDWLGQYVIAYRLPELVVATMGWIFSSVAFSLYSQTRKQGADAFRGSMLKALRIVTLIGFSSATGLAVVAPHAVPVLFSSRWDPAVPATVILSVAYGLSSVGYASGDIFNALGRPGVVLRLSAAFAPFTVLAFWFAAPHGIAWMAVVLVVFQVLYGVMRMRLANRLIGSTWGQQLRALGPACAATLGIVLFALPFSLVLDPSLPALLVVTGSGALGLVVALAVLAPAALRELLDLARSVRRP